MDRNQATQDIKAIFSAHRKISASESTWLRNLKSGKLYELYCLARVIGELRGVYGFDIRLVGSSIRFQSAPGRIRRASPHFEISNRSTGRTFKLYTDIEYQTLGRHITGAAGLSTYHEIDLVVVDGNATGRPEHDQIILGVECKSHANFEKSIVKEVLGIRRELSLLVYPMPSLLSAAAPFPSIQTVPADPPSEYWLAFLDPKGTSYQDSPAAFGIKFEHWQP